MQLVVPLCKRTQVLALAHESVWGAHLGVKKTSERIRYSFWWPGLKHDVINYVNTCQVCQKTSRRLASEDIPITPITRPELPWEV